MHTNCRQKDCCWDRKLVLILYCNMYSVAMFGWILTRLGTTNSQFNGYLVLVSPQTPAAVTRTIFICSVCSNSTAAVVCSMHFNPGLEEIKHRIYNFSWSAKHRLYVSKLFQYVRSVCRRRKCKLSFLHGSFQNSSQQSVVDGCVILKIWYVKCTGKV